jgi:hypothetical protein
MEIKIQYKELIKEKLVLWKNKQDWQTFRHSDH